MGIAIPQVITEDRASGAQVIDGSLLFNSTNSTYLNRTPASAGNRKTYTLSAWVKICVFGNSVRIFEAGTSSSTDRTLLYFSSNKFQFFTETGNVVKGDLSTNAIFRDPSAWYHVVWAVDTANTSVKIYVNGVEQTLTTTTAVANENTYVNATNVHYISQALTTTSGYLDGYLAEVNFIDGSALTPTSFGFTDPLTNTWRPKKYEGTYGTNGFYLPMDNQDDFEIDKSGNGNNWSKGNFSGTSNDPDVLPDSPSGISYSNTPTSGITTTSQIKPTNWCTLNPVGTTYGFIAPTDGNLKTDSNSYTRSTEGTFGIPKDGNLYYFEGTMTRVVGDGGTGLFFGVHTQGHTTSPSSSGGKGFVVYGTDGGAYDGALFAYQYDGNNLSPAIYGHIDSGTNLAFAIKYDSGTWSWYYRQGSNGWYHNTGSAWEYNSTFDETEPTATYSSVPENETLVPIGNNVIFNFGQKPFKYVPPEGSKTLCLANLPRPTEAAVRPDKYFKTVTYSGDNSSPRTVSTVGFQSDFVWIKNRTDTGPYHMLTDVVRGGGRTIFSNDTLDEVTNSAAGYISGFATNGFELTAGSSSSANVNATGKNYVAWCWKAGTSYTPTVTGFTSPTASINTESGFGIYKLTGNNVSTSSFTHGLGKTPGFIMAKNLDNTYNWGIWHKGLSAAPTNKYFIFTDAADQTKAGNIWVTINSTTIEVDSYAETASTGDYVYYVWAEIEGFSKIGTWTGNNNADGPYIHCGFRPAMIMWKSESEASAHWVIRDSVRDTDNPAGQTLYPSTTGDEQTLTTQVIDILSNGFKIRDTWSYMNTSGGTYHYIAFAETPSNNLFGGQANAR